MKWLLLLLFVGAIVGAFIGTTAKKTLASMHFIALPKELIIPSLHMDTSVEAVGLDKNGAIDVPKNVWDVAWYQDGPRPGEKGKAVIDGHYDSLTGPAIFYPLSQMKKNAQILVKDEDGKIHKFIVTEKHIYKSYAFPADVVYGPADDSELQLITCAGDFDHVHHNYLDRVVITAVTN